MIVAGVGVSVTDIQKTKREVETGGEGLWGGVGK